ncbi:hypothetical protein ECG_02109 [Echinococcus granulosus]|nr:hypothetical protein ECG_02109 [Echinococcus granulosus]
MVGVALNRAINTFTVANSVSQSVSQSGRRQASLLLAHHRLLRLLRQQHRLDVGQHTTLRNGHTAQQLVQLLVVADSQLQVTRNDTCLLVVARRVTRQLQHLGSQVLEHSSQVNRCSSTHPRAPRSCHDATDGAHDPRGTADQLAPTSSSLWPAICLLCLYRSLSSSLSKPPTDSSVIASRDSLPLPYSHLSSH